jgi:hypothetical protein
MLMVFLLSPAAGQAQEESADILDARLIYSFGGNEYSVENDSNFTGSTDEDHTWGDNKRFRLDVLNAIDDPVSFLGGVSVAGQNSSNSHAGSDLDFQSLSGRVNLGVGMLAADFMQFEILPFAGLGWSEADYALPMGSSRFAGHDSDRFFEYGLNLNAVFINKKHGFQLGGGIGYSVSDADYLFTDQNADLDTQVEQSGPIYSVFIGTRL